MSLSFSEISRTCRVQSAVSDAAAGRGAAPYAEEDALPRYVKMYHMNMFYWNCWT